MIEVSKLNSHPIIEIL